MGDKLTIGLQENLLILLVFNQESSSLIRNSVDPNLFSSLLYRSVAAKVYSYIDEYRKPPTDHLADLFEQELSGENSLQYSELFDALYNQRDRVNTEYVLTQLEKFIRLQSLKTSIIEASEALQEGDIELADEKLNKGLKQRMVAFSPGTRLSDGISKAFIHEVREGIIPTGIKHLDEWDVGPARGEFHLFIAPPKRGKTWWLVHLAKMGVLNHRKVLYLTLELSEKQIAMRLVQSLFSVQRRKAKISVTRLKNDDIGRLHRIEKDEITGRLWIDGDDPTKKSTKMVLEKKLGRIHGNENTIIKQFPSGQLTCRELVNYLDMLERTEKFSPDLIALDYPDYMKIDPKNYRLEMGALLNDLRGIAVERNLALVAARKSNREGAEAKLVTDLHSAEDYSGAYTADTSITYSQTKAEHALGLARLFVSSSRVAEKDQFVVLISQAYQIGQFVLDSSMMLNTYQGLLENAMEGMAIEKDD